MLGFPVSFRQTPTSSFSEERGSSPSSRSKTEKFLHSFSFLTQPVIKAKNYVIKNTTKDNIGNIFLACVGYYMFIHQPTLFTFGVIGGVFTHRFIYIIEDFVNRYAGDSRKEQLHASIKKITHVWIDVFTFLLTPQKNRNRVENVFCIAFSCYVIVRLLPLSLVAATLFASFKVGTILSKKSMNKEINISI